MRATLNGQLQNAKEAKWPFEFNEGKFAGGQRVVYDFVGNPLIFS